LLQAGKEIRQLMREKSDRARQKRFDRAKRPLGGEELVEDEDEDKAESENDV